MNRSMIKKISVSIAAAILLFVILQTGLFLRSIVKAEDAASGTTSDSATLSQAVLDKLQQNDPVHYDRNVTNYRNMLTALHVHPTLQQEVDRLILQDYPLPTLLIAYEFIYHQFGTIEDWKILVDGKTSDSTLSWESLFREYKTSHEAFSPRAFDSDYLERLLKNPSITSDDIMLADHISFKTGKPFKDIVEDKLESGQSWQDITAASGILYGEAELPRVPVTVEQLNQFTEPGHFTEEQVTSALVLAALTRLPAEDVIGKMKNGATEEAVWAESLQAKYE